MQTPLTSPNIKSIKLPATVEDAREAYAILVQHLGTERLEEMFSGMVVDINHAVPRNVIITLATLYHAANRHHLHESFLTEVRRASSFFSDRYRELTERYIALMIASQEFPNITEALPEHRVLGDSNPDWTLRTKQNDEFYLEVSAISIKKLIDDLDAFGGRIPTSKIIGSNQEPLYFEVVFPDDPRKYDPAAIRAAITEIVKTQQLPIAFTHDGTQILVDLLSTRHKLPQLISEELNESGFLKSTRLMGNRLAYTLATPTSFKSIGRKIDEKKRSNKLDKIGNAWLCIFIPASELDAFAKDSMVFSQLHARIARSKWLKGLFVAELLGDTTGNLQLRYIRI
jgi:hypothetical protein